MWEGNTDITESWTQDELVPAIAFSISCMFMVQISLAKEERRILHGFAFVARRVRLYLVWF
jgi:hypothetical protein